MTSQDPTFGSDAVDNASFVAAAPDLVDFGDARLHHLFLLRADRCATVTEYAHASGIDVPVTLELLTPAIEAGVIGLEVVGDTLFVDTAPAGRPRSDGVEQMPPNLWELLKVRAGERRAFALWKLIRNLEQGGWEVIVDSDELTEAAAGTGSTPWIGVRLGGAAVAVVPYPPAAGLDAVDGPLAVFAGAGVPQVAITCDNASLETYVTAVRSWVLRNRRAAGTLTVLLLEAPRFAPTALRVDDRGVHPVSVTRDET
jgi:hypothetical protein